MKKTVLSFLVLFALIISSCALAVVSPSDDFYVLDDANVLSSETLGMIVFSNDLLYEDSGAQFVVVTVNTTNNEDIGDYAYELFNEWGIGGKNDMGFLMLLAIDDEDYYFEPGTALSESMSWGQISGIVDEYLEPEFAKGNYDSGVSKVYRELFTILAKEAGSNATIEAGMEKYEEYLAGNYESETYNYSAETEYREDDYYDESGYRENGYYDDGYRSNAPKQHNGGSSMGFIIVIVIIIILIALLSTGRRRRVSGYHGVFWLSRPRAPRPPMPHRPPMGGPAPRPPMAGPAFRPSSRPTVSRPSFTSRPASRPTSSRSSFGGGRSSFGGSRPSTRSFGGGRMGGGGHSRGGGGGRGR